MRFPVMQDEKKSPPPAETARQEGAQGQVGVAHPAPNGAVDASDKEFAKLADEVHANA